MRPLSSLLLLCSSYGGTAIDYGSRSGKNGLDYCIAEADTTIGMTASTAMKDGLKNIRTKKRRREEPAEDAVT